MSQASLKLHSELEAVGARQSDPGLRLIEPLGKESHAQRPDAAPFIVSERFKMKLAHLEFEDLKPCDLNVRKKGHKDVADLVPSIRALGILQPLLVRPNCEGYEIIAGRRRYNALMALREGDGLVDPIPCIIMDANDDARAIEASLAENIARLPMDEVDQYKAFASLVDKGMTPEDIAAHFGVTERMVKQRLAIANIIEPILNAYRRDEIDASTLRNLTMATRKQQNTWWKLLKSEDEYAPTGRNLKSWLFGGAQLPVSNALFELADYKGGIISDLFGDERYFADADGFWMLQNAAIAAAAERYRQDGWTDVKTLEIGDHFQTWDHQKTTKDEGGKVFIAVSKSGEVSFHDGYLTLKEAQRHQTQGESDDVDPQRERSELTKAMRNYLALHKHAAVRVELLAHPDLALRLTVAHMIVGSSLWRVEAEPQRAENEGIATSIASSKAAAAFATERLHVNRLLGLEPQQRETLARQRHSLAAGYRLPELFATMIWLSDADVLRILAYLMAETLEAATDLTEILGERIGTDMEAWWAPEQTFFDLLRDREAIGGIVGEVLGEEARSGSSTFPLKVQKKAVLDHLGGTECGARCAWLPRYMRFPEDGYTDQLLA